LTDLREALAVERILKEVFQDGLPALSWVEVKGLRSGQSVAMDAIAVRPSERKDIYDFMG